MDIRNIFDITMIIGIVALSVKEFLLSYLKEKGRNLARKEDIEEITKKIESVKAQYTESIEKLKADLSIRNEQQLRIIEKRNGSLLKLYEDCCKLISEKIHPAYFLTKQYQTLSSVQISNENFSLKLLSNLINYPINYQRSTGRLLIKIISSGSKVFLFYPSNNPNDLVITSIIKLMESTYNFQQNFNNEFPKLMCSFNNIILPYLTKKHFNSIDFEIINNSINDYIKKMEPNIDAISKAVGQYSAALHIYFNNLGQKQLANQFFQK